MTRCSACQHSFPSHLVNPLVIGEPNGRVKSILLCPECGLKKQNEIHGMTRKNYSVGSIAQSLLVEAREYLAKPGGPSS